MATPTVTSTSAAPDPTYGSTTPAAHPNPQAAVAAGPIGQPTSHDPADLRLVIEDDQKAGCFVYKTIDWRTGEVVQQLPREELVKLREADNYAAGAVISTSV
jgi:flagellar protein FlaG